MARQSEILTTCCIAGGGPAGVMAGLLLARSGINVQILEKHSDFFRDFRGDTIHPSTMETLHELGLLDEFLQLPHQTVTQLKLEIDGQVILGPDFSHLPVRCPFIALVPQWDFLQFLSRHGHAYPGFHLRMNAEVVDIIEEGGCIAGVRAKCGDEDCVIRSDLVIGADGRHSTVRMRAGLPVDEIGVPIDVLWFRLPKRESLPQLLLGHIRNGKMLVTLDRGDYYQCGEIIPKGEFENIRNRGLDVFRRDVAAVLPQLNESIGSLQSWDQIKLLTVTINRLQRWARPGLLCIGDAAHAMSPAGGVGINLAIQDAIATANLLATKLQARTVSIDDLLAVQRRREWPTRMTQGLQAYLHHHMFRGSGKMRQPLAFPWPLKLLLRMLAPLLRHAAARVVGLGLRREHIRTGEIHSTSPRPN